MPNTKKILFFTEIDQDNPYGSHIRPFFLAKYLCSEKYDVFATCINYNINSKCPKFINLSSIFKFSRPKKYLYHLKYGRNIVQKIKPDYIYTHLHTASFTLGLLKILRIVKGPLIVDMHGSWGLEVSNSLLKPALILIESFCIYASDMTIVPSEELKKYFQNSYGVRPGKIVVVPNGVNNNSFRLLNDLEKENQRAKLGLANKKIIILTAPRNNNSNIIAIKLMYEVMKIAKEKGVNLQLLILGGGPTVGTPPANVAYTGFVRNFEMFMSIADVAVAPYPEGAAAGGARNKTLEYFKYEIPVVSTVEGIRGIDGAMPEKDFILSSDEPLDFLQKIIMCIGMDNKKRQKMIDDANDLVTQNYTWEKSAKQLNDFLKSLA